MQNIELYPGAGTNIGGYIDFHFNNEQIDYTSRIIESERGEIQINGISIAGLAKRTNFDNGLTVVTDANSAPCGFSQINADGTNIPVIARFVLFTAHVFTDYYKVQLGLADNGDGLFMRNYDQGSGVWRAWKKLAFET